MTIYLKVSYYLAFVIHNLLILVKPPVALIKARKIINKKLLKLYFFWHVFGKNDESEFLRCARTPTTEKGHHEVGSVRILHPWRSKINSSINMQECVCDFKL